jgi:hypothetical protein
MGTMARQTKYHVNDNVLLFLTPQELVSMNKGMKLKPNDEILTHTYGTSNCNKGDAGITHGKSSVTNQDEGLVFPENGRNLTKPWNGDTIIPPQPDDFNFIKPCSGCETYYPYWRYIHTPEDDEEGGFWGIHGGIDLKVDFDKIVTVDPNDTDGYPHLYFNVNLAELGTVGGCFQEWYLDGALWLLFGRTGGADTESEEFNQCKDAMKAGGYDDGYAEAYCQDILGDKTYWVQPNGLAWSPITYPDLILDDWNNINAYRGPWGPVSGEPWYFSEMWIHIRNTSTYLWHCYHVGAKDVEYVVLCEECDPYSDCPQRWVGGMGDCPEE